MAYETTPQDPLTLGSDLNAALSTLENALLEANRSIGALRGAVARVDSLAETVREMDSAISLAREKLGMAQNATPSAAPTYTTPPTSLDASAPTENDRGFEGAAPSWPTEPEIDDSPTESKAAGACLRIDVRANAGSLDLKAVDAAVKESSSVVDVALLDFDGRQATLKLWTSEGADPHEVRESLLSNLESRLGNAEDTAVTVEFAEAEEAA